MSVLSPIDGIYRSVWAYDANTGWESYLRDGPNPPDELKTIVPGRGYWVEMDADAVLVVWELPIGDGSVQLYKGWNLVGYNSLINMDVEEALASIAEFCQGVWGYDAVLKKWVLYWWDNWWAVPTLQLLSGKGYYLPMRDDCVWRLDVGY